MHDSSSRERDAFVLQPLRSTALRGAFNIVFSFLAWLVFFYWWTVVARATSAGPVQDALFVLVLFIAATLAVTFMWVRHNLGIAKRGKRGLTTRYVAPVFEKDFLNRRVELGPPLMRREAQWLVISADNVAKRYEERELNPFFSERQDMTDHAFERIPLGMDVP